MSSIETLEKRTVSALSYFGLYKLHLANLYLAYAQTQPWILNKTELHDVARSIIPTLSWKLDGTAITTAAHYRLAYSIIKDDPFITDDDKQIIYDAWQALRWRTHLLDLHTNQETLDADTRLERRKTNTPNCRWILEPTDLFARPPFIDLGLAGPLTYGDSLTLHLNGDTISIDDPYLAGLPSSVPLPPLDQITIEHAAEPGITHATPGHVVTYTMEPNATLEEYSNDLY